MNRIPFPSWPVEHKAVSSVLPYARPRFHRMFRPSPPDEHDHAFRSDPAGWLPMNTTTMLFLRSDPAMYVCASRRSRPCPYVRTWPYFLSCTLAAVHTCTCYVRASTSTRARLYYDMVHRCSLQTDRSTSMYVHVRDQDDNATYASTRWVPTVRHFLACEDVARGSQQSGGRIVLFFFCPDALPCVRRCSWWVPAVRGANHFGFFCPNALPCVRRCSWWVLAVRGPNRFFCPNALPCVQRFSWWVLAVRGGESFFFCPDALPCVRRCSWWVPAVRGKRFFSRNTVAPPVGPRCQVEE